MRYKLVSSPLGDIMLAEGDQGLEHISFQEGEGTCRPDPSWQKVESLRCPVEAQLKEYFQGSRTHFELPLAPVGTDFQKQVWRALQDVPYGATASYKDIAESIRRPKACRAVGAANGRNPLPIVIPCHRVIGASGKLTGYAGGLRFKQALLSLEAQSAGSSLSRT